MRFRTGWLPLVALAVVVLVGGLVLFVASSNSETSVATSSISAPLSPSNWSRIHNDEGVFGGEGGQGMLSVTAGGPGLVAVGSDGSAAAVWTSPDGITWSRVPHDESVFSGAGISSVTVGGPGLVAVGSDGVRAAVVWTSVDGITWSRVPLDEAVFESTWGREMVSMTVGGPGLVAVGNEGGDAAVWVWEAQKD